MIIQNQHLEKALNDLESAYESVPGEGHEYEDDEIALSIIERALADALRTSPDLLNLLDPTDIEPLDHRLKARAGRILAVRAILLYRLGHHDLCAHSTRLAVQAFRDTLAYRFDDEDRYVANHLHQLLMRNVAAIALRPHEIADSYEQLFDYYAGIDLYDRAEDMLFHAIELSDAPHDLIERGIAFYDELQQLDRRTLQTRGLPLHEVNESRRELVDQLQSQ